MLMRRWCLDKRMKQACLTMYLGNGRKELNNWITVISLYFYIIFCWYFFIRLLHVLYFSTLILPFSFLLFVVVGLVLLRTRICKMRSSSLLLAGAITGMRSACEAAYVPGAAFDRFFTIWLENQVSLPSIPPSYLHILIAIHIILTLPLRTTPKSKTTRTYKTSPNKAFSSKTTTALHIPPNQTI